MTEQPNSSPQAMLEKVRELKPKKFPERESDEYDAGYARAMEEFKPIAQAYEQMFKDCCLMKSIIESELPNEHDPACMWYFHEDHRIGCSCGFSSKDKALSKVSQYRTP